MGVSMFVPKNCDPSQKTERKPRKQNVHVKLTDEELSVLNTEMTRMGLDSRSAMARILIRKSLGML